jgi:hypothetical protein
MERKIFLFLLKIKKKNATEATIEKERKNR